MKKNMLGERLVISLFMMVAAIGLISDSHAADGIVTDDSYIRVSQPAANFGANNNLWVTSGTTSYLKFDLSTLPPGTSGNDIAKATLTFWVNTVTNPGSFDIHRVTGAWSEATITNNSAPPFNGIADVSVPIAAQDGASFITMDITILVKNWLDNVLLNDGIALVANPTTTNIKFDSKENPGHEPRLTITLAVAHDATLSGDGTRRDPLGISSKVALLNASNNFLGDQSISGSLSVGGSSGNVKATRIEAGGNTGEALGIYGTHPTGFGVFGNSVSGDGVRGVSTTGLAGNFLGDVDISGTLLVGGSLNLPANGLLAGTNQFVLSGGNVGIGITTPAAKLEIASSDQRPFRLVGSGNFDWTGVVDRAGTAGGGGFLLRTGSINTGSAVFQIETNHPDLGGASTTRIFMVKDDGRVEVGGTTSAPAGIYAFHPTGMGVFGNSGGTGVDDGTKVGVRGEGITGVDGFGRDTGVSGRSTNNIGVQGVSVSGDGVRGVSTTGLAGNFIGNVNISGSLGNVKATRIEAGGTTGEAIGIYGFHPTGFGVSGNSGGVGVAGQGSTGVDGFGDNVGVSGRSTNNIGVQGVSGSGDGVRGVSTSGLAGNFIGNVNISGALSVGGSLSKGSGSFKIDHPLDPENKYLYHSFVESPDMMNIYNGNVTTDASGEAVIILPDYFEALNKDFRYQLTVVGQFAQAMVAQEINDNRFVVRTDKPGVKVSWQVTGIRKDAYAEKHRIPVEEEKPAAERGHYETGSHKHI